MRRISAPVLWLLCSQIFSPLIARSFPDSLLSLYIRPLVELGERELTFSAYGFNGGGVLHTSSNRNEWL